MVALPPFIEAMTAQQFGPYIGVPCSFLKPLINYVIDHDDLDYIAATNEGEALAIASGAYLAGHRPVVMFQNSGLGNMVNPLVSLTFIFRIPILLITTWRGQPELGDEPQHQLMGEIMADLLDLVRVENESFPTNNSEIVPKVNHAIARMEKTSLPFAFILSKGGVDSYELRTALPPMEPRLGEVIPGNNGVEGELPLRRDAIASIVDTLGEDCLIVATTGKTARELFEYKDRSSHFYMVGSMGCAPSLALGLALYHRTCPIAVLDGDGAALMRMEALASIGHARPENLIHVIFDNGAYESTGGQRTISASVSFPHTAAACGYATACSVQDLEGLDKEVARARTGNGPHLIHVRIRAGSRPDLSRPSVKPHEVAQRFREAVATWDSRNVSRGS